MRLHAEREARTAQALADEQQLAAGRARVEELRAAQEEAAAAGARASASAGDGRQEAELSEQSKALQAGLIEAARRLDAVSKRVVRRKRSVGIGSRRSGQTAGKRARCGGVTGSGRIRDRPQSSFCGYEKCGRGRVRRGGRTGS